MAKKREKIEEKELSVLEICNLLKITDRTRTSIMREYAKTKVLKDEWVKLLKSRQFVV